MFKKWQALKKRKKFSFHIHFNENNMRTEPKYIVFLSQLLLLFQVCRSCKGNNVLVETTQHGTLVIVETHCGNPDCLEKEFVWHSQPKIEGTKAVAVVIYWHLSGI